MAFPSDSTNQTLDEPISARDCDERRPDPRADPPEPVALAQPQDKRGQERHHQGLADLDAHVEAEERPGKTRDRELPLGQRGGEALAVEQPDGGDTAGAMAARAE